MGQKEIIMLVRFLFFISLTILTGCQHVKIHLPTLTSAKSMPGVPAISQKRSLATFATVVIKANLNINLHTGHSPQIVLKGNPIDIQHTHTTVVNGILFLKFDSGYPHYGPICADIYTRRFDTIVFSGIGLIKGKNLKTNNLNLFIKNKGRNYLQGDLRLRRVTLTGGYSELIGVNSPGMVLKLNERARAKIVGRVNLVSLSINDNSVLSMYWMRSKTLIIRAYNHSIIQLAGIVDKLDVELWGNARFKGRYLRAERAFVKTHNNSVADIAAVKKQHTLATDTSDIRFYNIPTFKSDFMGIDGAVLDMRGLGSPFVQEYSEYNK